MNPESSGSEFCMVDYCGAHLCGHGPPQPPSWTRLCKKAILLTRRDRNVGSTCPDPVCAEGVRSTGFILEGDENLLSYFPSDYGASGGKENAFVITVCPKS